MSKINVVEIFSSIQGEGPNVGARCIFVRVKGCDFACSFCDSKFTWNNEPNFTQYTDDELTKHLITMCKENSCNRIVLTGGNPCLYDFERIISELRCNNIKVDIETQGSKIPDWLSHVDQIVFSPKPPSSGMPDTYKEITTYILENNHIQSADVSIKIPVFNDEDIEFARNYAKFVNEFIRKNDNNIRHDNNINLRMYLSVGNSDVDTSDSIRDRVLTDYEHLLDVINKNPEQFQNIYILPQIHTLVWGNKQGV